MANGFGQLGAVPPLVGPGIENQDLVPLAVAVLSPDDPEFVVMCGDPSETELLEFGFEFLPDRRCLPALRLGGVLAVLADGDNSVGVEPLVGHGRLRACYLLDQDLPIPQHSP